MRTMYFPTAHMLCDVRYVDSAGVRVTLQMSGVNLSLLMSNIADIVTLPRVTAAGRDCSFV